MENYLIVATAANEHVIETIKMMYRHLKHMDLTMQTIYRPPGSYTTFNVLPLLRLLDEFVETDRILNIKIN